MYRVTRFADWCWYRIDRLFSTTGAGSPSARRAGPSGVKSTNSSSMIRNRISSFMSMIDRASRPLFHIPKPKLFWFNEFGFLLKIFFRYCYVVENPKNLTPSLEHDLTFPDQTSSTKAGTKNETSTGVCGPVTRKMWISNFSISNKSDTESNIVNYLY